MRLPNDSVPRLGFLLVLALFLASMPRAMAASGPLYVTPPTTDWKVQYQNTGGNDAYIFTPPDGVKSFFTFARWGAPARPDQLPRLLNTITTHYTETAQTDPKIQFDAPTPTNGEIIGDPFTGKYVAFSLKNGSLQVLFIVTDGKTLWNGQYVGPVAGWDDARHVLEVLKKW